MARTMGSPRGIARRSARLITYGLGCAAAAAAWHSCTNFIGVAHRPKSADAVETQAANALATMTAVMLTSPADVLAKGGEFGPLEGKASSVVHPFIEACLFLTTLYAGFLGWNWRQTRLVGVEVSDLRKQLSGIKSDDAEAPETAAEKELKAKIAELSDNRKELIAGNFKDRHYQLSSTILGGGIFFTFYGVFNTWFRAQKLFPGPHLFAGAAIVVGWALAAACVPYMEKGNEAARNIHIALNVIILGLFCWQLPTGWEILCKVWAAPIPWF